MLTGHHAFDVTLGTHAVLLREVQDQLLCRLELVGGHEPPQGLGEDPAERRGERVNVFASCGLRRRSVGGWEVRLGFCPRAGEASGCSGLG